MPTTPIFGWPYEQYPSDAPGTSLYGGELGTDPILAEEIEGDVSQISQDILAIEDRVDQIEDNGILGWTYIAHGIAGNVVSVDIDLTKGGVFPAGTFDMIRLHGRFGLNSTGYVNLQVNGATGSIYRTGSVLVASDGTVTPGLVTTDTRWRIAYGATNAVNNFVCQIFHTNADNLLNYQSKSSRMSDLVGTHSSNDHWGSIVSPGVGATPSTLTIMRFGAGAEINDIWWWAEGFRTP